MTSWLSHSGTGSLHCLSTCTYVIVCSSFFCQKRQGYITHAVPGEVRGEGGGAGTEGRGCSGRD